MGRQALKDFAQAGIGDLIFSQTDAIAMTKDFKEAIVNIFKNRISAATNGWENFLLAPDLDLFVGEKNTEEVAERMKTKIIDAMTYDGFLLPGEFTIDIVPIDEFSIGILSEIQNVGTISLIFDYNEGIVEVS